MPGKAIQKQLASISLIQLEVSMLTPKHIKAARAILGWSVRDLEERTGVSFNTIIRYETGATKDLLGSTMTTIKREFEGGGIEFDTDGMMPSIRWRRILG